MTKPGSWRLEEILMHNPLGLRCIEIDTVFGTFRCFTHPDIPKDEYFLLDPQTNKEVGRFNLADAKAGNSR